MVVVVRGARRERASAATRPARHPGCRPRRATAGRAHRDAARRPAPDDLRRDRGGHRRDRGAPGGLHHLAVPVADARRDRDRGAGHRRVATWGRATSRELGRRPVGWCSGASASGVLLGVVLIALRAAFVPLFTDDPEVRSLLETVLVVAAVAQPVCGVVFALDGVLIGAGDNSYLAWAGVWTLASFVPLALLVLAQDAGLVWLWWAFDVFLVARLVTLVAAVARRGMARHRRSAAPTYRRIAARRARISRRSSRRPPRGAGRRDRCAGRTPRSCAARARGCRWSPRPRCRA